MREPVKPQIDPQRWKLIDDLLDAAIELEPEKRSSYLEQACGDDEDLRNAVQSLLDTDARAENFIALPVLDPGSQYVDDRLELREREVIADRFELLSRLGSGGMGEVWLAFDLKLRVNIVLKTLHFQLNRSPHRLEALHREIRNAREVISPNVCRIFDLVIDHEGDFISMEYIDGMTLAAMLQSQDPLPLSKARDIAAQFLSGLQAIHAAELVHCDLKPENIMITHTGRVVVMDFGIAKQIAQTSSAISGTPAYMSPEQLCGSDLDARTDIFGAGIILAEMTYTQGILTEQMREEIWKAVRVNPLQLPDSPWKSVIERAVAAHPEDRFPSAAALARALEEATERVQTVEERRPYPGLASFTEANSEYFFGRELEVETVIKKLQQLHFMALVGPSGAGKTSFLRAGLIPALPQGWSCIFVVPGDSPFLNLGQALAPELSGDTEAMQRMLSLEDPKNAEWLFSRWRNRHSEALLIVDRFEELFTLNTQEIQQRFADLIAGATLEPDIHVLLSMRDDFLLRCHDHPSLAPIFSELTPMGALAGPALRRALAQPALKCGYRFEDDTLIDDILADVEKERGALPLMAFAASRLWEKRDRQKGQLTRQAYREVGGVAGALAQHAEQTMERIGPERQPMVREIFRNLITAENTRAARDVDDLLSVFPDKQLSEEVLRALIDARLLTSFEAPAAVEGSNSKHRIEIIHESLLSAWPRLVRWQTQDADSAQLRDQLRQAAQLWEQRNRSEDLLWTGTAYLDFEAWRQRYAGGLSATEEAFATAMTHKMTRNRRQKQMLVATTFVVLIAVLILISIFWRNASNSRDEAVAEAKRAEAAQILALGRSIQNADPTTKLAYAISSLESADSSQGRHFALQAIAEGPLAQVIRVPGVVSMELSPDHKSMAVGDRNGQVQLMRPDTTEKITVQASFQPGNYILWNSQFSPDGKYLIWTWRENPSIVKVWSLSERRVIRSFEFEGLTMCQVRGGTAFFITDPARKSESIVRIWKFDQGEPQTIGRFPFYRIDWTQVDIDPLGKWLAYSKAKSVYVASLDPRSAGVDTLIGSHSVDINSVKFHPQNPLLASRDSSGEIRMWNFANSSLMLHRTIAGGDGDLSFDPEGRFLLTGALRWDLKEPDSDPETFRAADGSRRFVFHSKEDWMASSGPLTLQFFPSARTYPYRYTVPNGGAAIVRFTPDGKSLIGGFFSSGLRIWNMPGEQQSRVRAMSPSGLLNETLDLSPDGQHIAIPENGIHIISTADGQEVSLKGKLPDNFYSLAAYSPDGRSIAAAAAGVGGIELFDLNTKTSTVIEQSRGKHFSALQYGKDNKLFAGSEGSLYQWSQDSRSLTVLVKSKKKWVTDIAVSQNGQFLAAAITSAITVFQLPASTADLILYDIKSGKTTPMTSHGNRVFSVDFNRSSEKLVTGDLDGNVRIGPIGGQTPHMFAGIKHEDIYDVAIHPNGKWIGAASGESIYLWPMPKGDPLHALPYEKFLDHIRSLTNVRVVKDQNAPAGYRIDYSPFVIPKALNESE